MCMYTCTLAHTLQTHTCTHTTLPHSRCISHGRSDKDDLRPRHKRKVRELFLYTQLGSLNSTYGSTPVPALGHFTYKANASPTSSSMWPFFYTCTSASCVSSAVTGAASTETASQREAGPPGRRWAGEGITGTKTHLKPRSWRPPQGRGPRLPASPPASPCTGA